MEIKYLEAFKNASKFFKLTGNKLLIERLEVGEAKTKGGIIIADSSNVRADLRLQKASLAVVLAVGEGYFDADTKTYIPLEVEPGDLVIINSAGAMYYSLLPGVTDYTGQKVGVTTETDIQLKFKSLADYDAYVKALENVEAK